MLDTQESIFMELSWELSNRSLEIRLWLYQPFLFYAVYHPTGTASTATDNHVFPAEQRGLRHGTWTRAIRSG